MTESHYGLSLKPLKIRIPIISDAIRYVAIFIWSLYHFYKSWSVKRALKKLIKVSRHYGTYFNRNVER